MDFWQRQRAMFEEREMEIIRESAVLVAGAGGLGTHQALELQRVGVGRIYILDYDRIEASNLNRQVLYGRQDIGELKAETLARRLGEFDLGTEVVPLNQKITAELQLPGDVDLVFEALDNFAARYTLEQLLAERDLPLVHAGIRGWYGQITMIIPGKTPCLRDIFGEQPPGEEGEIPVLSPVVSSIASLQVIEGLKYLLQKGDNLVNRLMIMDFRDYSLDLIQL